MSPEGRRILTLFGEMTGKVPSFPEPTRERFTDVDRRLSGMPDNEIEAELWTLREGEKL